jgi:Rrf2 family protein
VRITARVDYAVRAAVELAAAEPGRPVKADAIAQAQDIPPRFLDHILASLRHGGLVQSRRGAEGGHMLAQPAEQISIADVIRAVDGPLASVGGLRPDQLAPQGTAVPLQRVWIAVRSSLRDVLEDTTLADVAAGKLPKQVEARAGGDDAWAPH